MLYTMGKVSFYIIFEILKIEYELKEESTIQIGETDVCPII